MRVSKLCRRLDDACFHGLSCGTDAEADQQRHRVAKMSRRFDVTRLGRLSSDRNQSHSHSQLRLRPGGCSDGLGARCKYTRRLSFGLSVMPAPELTTGANNC